MTTHMGVTMFLF
ncbi:hypothetical protein LINPERHAP2_LOCUS4349 [Linum perenne]